jgi:hypothetical protein
MTLDLAVSRAVAQSQLLERALHSRAPWYIEIGGVRAAAERTEHEHGVSFTACFPNVPVESNVAALFEGLHLRSARPFEYPGSGEFCITWDLSLEESLTV